MEKTTNNVFFKKATDLLILLNVFFLQSYIVRFDILAYHSNLQEVLICLLGLVFLVKILVEKKFWQTIKNLRKHWIITTFIILSVLSVLTTDTIEYTYFLRHIKFIFFGSVLAFIFLENFTEKSEQKKAINIMGLGAVAIGIFSLIYNILGYGVTQDLRLAGPFESAVILSYYLTPFFIYFSIEFFENFKKKHNLFLAIILGLLIILTRSIGSIVGAFLVLIIYLLKKSDLGILKNRISKIALIIATILILASGVYIKILPAFETNNTSLGERGQIWKTSMYLLKEPTTIIWGLGLGQFEEYYRTKSVEALGKAPLDFNNPHPHNIFFLFIFEYGLLGLFFIIICIYRTIKILKKSDDTSDLKVVVGFMLLYFFLHGMIDSPFFKNDMTFLMILFMEIALKRTPMSSLRKQGSNE